MEENSAHDPARMHLGRAQGGDESSLHWLIERFEPYLIYRARSYLRNSRPQPEDERDLVHEVWEVFLRKIDQINVATGNPTAIIMKFLQSTLSREWLSHLKKTSKKPKSGLSTISARTSGVITKIARGDAQRQVAKALDSLPEKHREIVELRSFDQLQYRQIGDALQISADAAESRYRQALMRLREIIPGSVFDQLENF